MFIKKYAVNLNNEGVLDSEVITNMKDITAGISYYFLQGFRFEQIVKLLKEGNQKKVWKFRLERMMDHVNSVMTKFKDEIKNIGIQIDIDQKMLDRVRSKKLKMSEYEYYCDKCYMTLIKIASQVSLGTEAEILMNINYYMKTVEDYIRTECLQDLRRLGIEFDFYSGVTKTYN